jgi:hypothetical protein
MLNISSNEHFIEYIDYVASKIDQYFASFIFIFGVVGNCLNILVLSQLNLRSNLCAWLFLMSSIADLISILFGLVTRIMARWPTDPAGQINL